VQVGSTQKKGPERIRAKRWTTHATIDPQMASIERDALDGSFRSPEAATDMPASIGGDAARWARALPRSRFNRNREQDAPDPRPERRTR
jgi:class 3 adenylate cyclase